MDICRLVQRVSVLTLRSPAVRLDSCRSVATSSIRMEKAMEKLQTNPYYEKYADRIARLQKTDPKEFLDRVSRTVSPERKPSGADKAPVDTRQYSSVLNPKEALPDGVSAEEKKLDAIFKTDLVKDKDASEIQVIWQEYHKDKDVISATIPADAYTSLRENMKQFPTFLFPLPRDQGYEFILCQSFGHSVHFTPLLAFQVHKENAPECLTMVHYTELKDKGIVLMRGEYDKNVLSGREAQCLANQFQLYYGAGAEPARRELLQCFTASPDSFKHMDLIAQLENISLV
ncbi:ATP synthase mitochondrial F1 complex assembly factor 1 [Leguminivora glycinivorella]|uniref:ATP synthase mitochondrial F1 complex assembly factor 1 n=1 Tax=Leguminivora glycinivorella TaxID=1035111 RepID=UPI00200DF3B2|nr:ATP synthase mitochondrial F1 complex assembly factor 1 [Leguminivora glycinivorella]